MSKSICAGPGASNVISDSVSMSGTLRAITTSHFERMRDRITEAGFILPAPPSNVPVHIYFGFPTYLFIVPGGHACSDSASSILVLFPLVKVCIDVHAASMCMHRSLRALPSCTAALPT